MKTTIILVFLLFVGCSNTQKDEEAHTDQSHTTPTAQAQDSSFQFLYGINGTSGSYENSRLVINGVSDKATYFTDRPGRKAGTVNSEEFVTYWQKMDSASGMANDPPNAILTISPPEGNPASAVVELLQTDFSNGTATFKVNLLEGEIPPSFGHSSLVIDAFPTPVNSQITDITDTTK